MGQGGEMRRDHSELQLGAQSGGQKEEGEGSRERWRREGSERGFRKGLRSWL